MRTLTRTGRPGWQALLAALRERPLLSDCCRHSRSKGRPARRGERSPTPIFPPQRRLSAGGERRASAPRREGQRAPEARDTSYWQLGACSYAPRSLEEGRQHARQINARGFVRTIAWFRCLGAPRQGQGSPGRGGRDSEAFGRAGSVQGRRRPAASPAPSIRPASAATRSGHGGAWAEERELPSQLAVAEPKERAGALPPPARPSRRRRRRAHPRREADIPVAASRHAVTFAQSRPPRGMSTARCARADGTAVVRPAETES